jgi:hypothetical protein
LTQSKKQQQKSIAIVFRFAVVLRAFSKWGVPQTPESNTKVLLAVLRAVYLASGCAYSSNK